MAQNNVPTPEQQSTEVKDSSKWPIQRIVFVSAGVLGALIAVVLVVGLLLAFSSEFEVTALRIQYIRNLFMIVLTFEGILIIGAIAILIVQLSRLINMLKREVKPVLTTAQETVKSARGTVDFVSENAVSPIIRTSSFMSGLAVVLRDIGGIRRAIRRTKLDAEK